VAGINHVLLFNLTAAKVKTDWELKKNKGGYRLMVKDDE
jgi:hypothetical protein